MKIKTAIFKRCKFCYILKRNKFLFIKCKKFQKHKQKQK